MLSRTRSHAPRPTFLITLSLFIALSSLVIGQASATGLDRIEKRIRPSPIAVYHRQLFGGDDDDDDNTNATISDPLTATPPITTAPITTTNNNAAASSSSAAAESSASLASVASAASASAASAASASLASESAALASSLAAQTSTVTTDALATSTDPGGSIVVVTSIVGPTNSATAQPDTEPKDTGNHTALIAGVSGAVGGVALLGGLVYLLMRFTGKRSGFDDNDADIKWPELKHAEGDVAAMQPLPARRTGGAGFDMGEDAYSDGGHGSRLNGDDVDNMGRTTTMSDVGGGAYGHQLATSAGVYGGSSAHLTGAGAYGSGYGNTHEYADSPHGYPNPHEYGSTPDYAASQDGHGGAYYSDYTPSRPSPGQSAEGGATAGGGAYLDALVEPNATSPHAYMSGYDDGGYGVAVPSGTYQDHPNHHHHQQPQSVTGYGDAPTSSPSPPPGMGGQGYSTHQQQDYRGYGYR